MEPHLFRWPVLDVLLPLMLNGHPGTKYGLPFPVVVRASFGVRGANLPAVLRALVACGWFGIQCWFGGLGLWATASARDLEIPEHAVPIDLAHHTVDQADQ